MSVTTLTPPLQFTGRADEGIALPAQVGPLPCFIIARTVDEAKRISDMIGSPGTARETFRCVLINRIRLQMLP
jgi:hypothetical protein